MWFSIIQRGSLYCSNSVDSWIYSLFIVGCWSSWWNSKGQTGNSSWISWWRSKLGTWRKQCEFLSTIKTSYTLWTLKLLPHIVVFCLQYMVLMVVDNWICSLWFIINFFASLDLWCDVQSMCSFKDFFHSLFQVPNQSQGHYFELANCDWRGWSA